MAIPAYRTRDICYKNMYTLHNQKYKKLDVRQAPNILRVPEFNKIKKVNFLNKNKSKNYIGLNINKRK